MKGICLSLIISFFSIVVFSSCFNFKGVGEDLGEGLQNKADSVGRHLILGVVDGFTTEDSQVKLRQKLDSLLKIVGNSTNVEMIRIRDSLLGEYTRQWLNEVKNDIIGDVTRRQLGRIRDELLGDKTLIYLMNVRNELIGYNTRELLKLIISELRNELLNDTTSQKLSTIRNVLLGPETRSGINTIVDSAMITIANRYRSDLKPELQDWGFLQRNITEILLLTGVIVCIIIGYVWYQKQKYLKMTKMLTYQISEVKEPDLKEKLKIGISQNAKMLGVEDILRKMLDEQGLLHTK
ncbi:MAG TPA: hypothetical protein PKD94_02050 [Ignavibacteria bacterium]|nr:hypothetical protein [Ignavibacteria bacterium]